MAVPCKFNLSFSDIMVFENPNLVCLGAGDDTVLFDRVIGAEINTKKSEPGAVFTVFCGDFLKKNHCVAYTLVCA